MILIGDTVKIYNRKGGSQLKTIVKDIFEFKDVEGLKVIAGKSGLNRVISGVQIIEELDFDTQLDEEDFIIIDENFIKNDSLEVKDLITKISRIKVAAIGINFGESIDEQQLSDEVLVIANQADLPIISIPNYYILTNLINVILRKTTNKRNEVLTVLENIYESFTQLIINEAGVQQIIIELRELLDRQVAFYDITFNNFYMADTSNQFMEDMELLSLKKIANAYQCYPVKIKDEIYGYIVLAKNKNEKDGNRYDKVILEHGKMAIEMVIRRNISNQLKVAQQKFLIQDLIFNNFKSEEFAEKRAYLCNWDIKERMVVMVLKIKDLRSDRLEVKQESSNQIVNKVDEKIILNLKNIINDQFKDSISLDYSKSIVFIIKTNLGRRNFRQRLEELIYEIKTSIDEHNLNLIIGIGKIKSSIARLYESYNEAIQVIKLKQQVDLQDEVVFYDDLGIYKLLRLIHDKDEVEQFYSSYLGNLIKYDQENGTELLKNLSCLIKNDWNLKAASEELYIHYNTMKYRFKKMGKILELDLKDPEVKFNITCAIKLLKMNEELLLFKKAK